MTLHRLEVRIDPEQRKKLEIMAEEDAATVSDLVRQMIDERFAERLKGRRMAAARRLVSRQIEDVPNPEELSHQLAEAHDPSARFD